MRPLKYRIFAVLVGLLGVTLIGLVWRAVYMTDPTSETLMFRMGMPLVLLATVAGGLLVAAAFLTFAFAKRCPVAHERPARRVRTIGAGAVTSR
jgi:hypothetical protein